MNAQSKLVLLVVSSLLMVQLLAQAPTQASMFLSSPTSPFRSLYLPMIWGAPEATPEPDATPDHSFYIPLRVIQSSP